MLRPSRPIATDARNAASARVLGGSRCRRETHLVGDRYGPQQWLIG